MAEGISAVLTTPAGQPSAIHCRTVACASFSVPVYTVASLARLL
jgi:hypothetical protein